MHRLIFICLVVFVSVQLTNALIGRTQSTGVKGRLICQGKPAKGVKVKLYDIDVTSDDFMGETKSDSDGYFQVTGHTDEITDIDPKFNVYHNCKDKVKLCQKKFTIKIPSSYISSGKTPSKIYDAGVINIEGHPGDERRDCIN